MRVLLLLCAALALAALVLWLRPGRERVGATQSAESAETELENDAPRAELVAAAVLEDAEPGPERVRLESGAPPSQPIAGRVEVSGGIPPLDEPRVVAHLQRRGAPREPPRPIVTPVARDGSFAFEVPSDARTVSLELESLVLALSQVEVQPGTTDVVLRPEVRAAVRGHTHRPAHVPLSPPRGLVRPIRDTCVGKGVVEAAGDGWFVLTLAPGKPFVLEAESAEGEPESGPARASGRLALEALSPGEIRDVELFLEPWITLRGLVTDTSGAPVAGAAVLVGRAPAQPPDAIAERNAPNDLRTGADGRFGLPPLPPGAWQVWVRAAGRFSERQTLVLPGEGEEELLFVLDAPAIVRGRVLRPDGAPCSGAWVMDVGSGLRFVSFRKDAASSHAGLGMVVDERWDVVPEPSLATDGEGRFVLEVDSRLARLTAGAASFAPSTPLELELEPGQELDGIVLELRPECRLRGKVLDEDGRPVLSSVRFASADGIEVALFPREGEFALRQLPPGPARIECPPDGTPGGLEGSYEFELDPDQESVIEVRLKGKRPW